MGQIQHCITKFNIVNGLTGKKRSSQLPEGLTDSQLAADFATFFFQKIDKIHTDIENYLIQNMTAKIILGLSKFSSATQAHYLFYLYQFAVNTNC